MRFPIQTLILVVLLCTSCQNPDYNTTAMANNSFYSNIYKAANQSADIICQLTNPAFHNRKELVLAYFKEHLIDQKELNDGYAFKFSGTDETLDWLTEFIKTERTCCNFFVFGLSISGDQSEIWLEITGPDGTKDFIIDKLEF